jgi:hypothetical protein
MPRMRAPPASVLLVASVLAACGDDGAAPAAPDAAPPAPDAAVACDEADLVARLSALPDIAEVVEAPCEIDGARCFAVTMTLPIVPGDPAAGTFGDRLHLIHRGCDAPTIVDTSGYALWDDYFYDGELGAYFGTNWIELEHRFQGGSMPALDAWRWDALTVANGAADVHRLLEILRPFYAGRWVTTGASKGGATTLYHRQLYPDDVDGSVPYVAPISIAREDRRYLEPFAAIGPEACRAALHAVVVSSLTTRRATLAPMVATALELAIEDGDAWLDYLTAWLEWGFWQYTGTRGCADLPAADATDAAVLDFLLDQNGFGPEPVDLPGRPGGAPFDPDQRADLALSYEWLTEQGFAVQISDEVNGLLSEPISSMADDFTAATTDPLPDYDATASEAVRAWVAGDAEKLVLVYGQWDPWSGGATPAPTGADTGYFVVPEAGHWASIGGLPEVEQAQALELVAGMLGVAPAMERRAEAAASERRRQRLTARRVAENARAGLRLRRTR